MLLSCVVVPSAASLPQGCAPLIASFPVAREIVLPLSSVMPQMLRPTALFMKDRWYVSVHFASFSSLSSTINTVLGTEISARQDAVGVRETFYIVVCHCLMSRSVDIATSGVRPVRPGRPWSKSAGKRWRQGHGTAAVGDM